MAQGKYEIFICYSRKDIAIANKVCESLDREGISYFINRQEMEENDKTLKSLTEKIADSKLFLLLASENSYGSDFILDQIREAYYNAPMVTYVIDGAKLPLEIDDLFGFMDWYDVDDHPIDTVLMDALRMKLGYGYRKSVLTEREKYLLALPDDEFVKFIEQRKFGDRYGFKLRSTGEEVFPPKYNDVSNFCEGLARVKDRSYVGFIDKTGAEVVPLEYNSANFFREGLAAVWTDEGCGFIDKTGKVVIPIKYGIIESFSEGLAVVSPSGQCKFGFINNKGEAVIPFKYNDAGSFRGGLAKAQLQCKGKYGFIDKSGEAVIHFRYDKVQSFSGGLAAVSIDGLWGYIDKKGKEIIPIKLKYDAVFPFRGGLACVELGRKFGFINNEGKEVISVIYEFCIYTLAIGFMNGETCRVKLNDEYFWIDKNGNRVDESIQKYWDNKIPLQELGKLSIFVETE